MARLLFLDTMGAGRVFQAETNALHERFARLIQGYLDEAVAAAVIPPIDTRIASIAWFGALNEVVARWLLADHAGRLEDAYPALRAILLRSVGVGEPRIAAVPLPAIADGARLPGAGPMTAVRPGSRTDDIGVPAMDARLAALLADADGALASVTAPMAAIDPIALFAAAVEADLEAALWLRPADGTALRRHRARLGDRVRGARSVRRCRASLARAAAAPPASPMRARC